MHRSWYTEIDLSTSTSQWVCTGSLISPTSVLTAAHCVFDDSNNWAPFAGSFSVRVNPSSLGVGGTVRTVDFYHAGAVSWSPTQSGATRDVAILHLSTPVTNVPIALAPGLAGNTNQTMKLFGRRNTSTTTGACGSSPSCPDVAIAADALCYRERSGYIVNKIEQGDSGGPVVVTGSTGIDRQIGILSGPAGGGYHGASVGAYWGFIREWATDLPNRWDINGDGYVDCADENQLLAAYGTTNAVVNINGSAVVDIFDLSALLSNWSAGQPTTC